MTLPVRRQAQMRPRSARDKTKVPLLIHDNPEEALNSALRKAFKAEWPERSCWFNIEDLEVTGTTLRPDETAGTAWGRVKVCWSDPNTPARRCRKPYSVRFHVEWRLGSERRSGFPATHLVSHELTLE